MQGVRFNSFASILKYTLLLWMCGLLLGCNVTETKIQQLLDRLVSNEHHIDQGAFNALLAMGNKAVPAALFRLQQETDPWKQRYYLILLIDIGDISVIPKVLPYLDSKNDHIREWAALILARHGGQESIGPLIGSLDDEAFSEGTRETMVAKLKHLTGQNFPYTAEMSSLTRQETIRAWQKWWKTQQR